MQSFKEISICVTFYIERICQEKHTIISAHSYTYRQVANCCASSAIAQFHFEFCLPLKTSLFPITMRSISYTTRNETTLPTHVSQKVAIIILLTRSGRQTNQCYCWVEKDCCERRWIQPQFDIQHETE